MTALFCCTSWWTHHGNRVHGLSEFRDLFPNGYNLDDKEFGHTADTTRGESSEGGDDDVILFGHNQFGRDYAAAEDEWTVRLCALDSDGDGQSNGHELGDPCCQWTTSNYLGVSIENFTTNDISSPGRSYYTTTRSAAGTCRDVEGRLCDSFSWQAFDVVANLSNSGCKLSRSS